MSLTCSKWYAIRQRLPLKALHEPECELDLYFLCSFYYYFLCSFYYYLFATNISLVMVDPKE